MHFREINSNITQIPTIHICVRETCVVNFSAHKCVQMDFMYTECINLCDVGKNFSNSKKPTNKQLHEHQFRFHSKLGVREVLWRIPQKKFANKYT